MPVELFTEGLEPSDQNAVVWRFMELWKFKDVIQTGELYFRRSDKLEDEHEGLPPEKFACETLGLNPYDISDIRKLNNDLGSTAQFRQAFYINCWYLFDHETAAMWAKYGKDGVAIASRYSLLKSVLDPMSDRPHLGLVRYGWTSGTRWNTQRFITTKREEYAHEREVRALLWILNSGDGANRHIDINNRMHPQPIYEPPATLPEGIRRPIQLATLFTDVVLTPMQSPTLKADVQSLLRKTSLNVVVRPSALTQYASFLPTADDLSRFR